MTGCELNVCDGSGWIEIDDQTAKPCGCRELKANRTASLRLGTGLPKRFRGVGFDRQPIVDLDPKVVREIRVYIRDLDLNLNEGRGLWIFGDVGTGKTSLAMLVSKAALDAGKSVAIYSMPRLLADIMETYGENSRRSYMDLYERLTSVDLLHIDDLGTERRNEWVLEQLYSIVNERWQQERSMIVTTNIYDEDELREQLGFRTFSRLEEMCEQIPVFGDDLRKQKWRGAA